MYMVGRVRRNVIDDRIAHGTALRRCGRLMHDQEGQP